MKAIICGSPQWAYNEIVKDVIAQLHRESRLKGKRLLIIHGGESGPETVAQEYCEKLGIDVITHPSVLWGIKVTSVETILCLITKNRIWLCVLRTALKRVL